MAISKADLIVADLTGRNANVYYELGVAHSYKRHVVPMINRDVDPNPPPFDNYAERTISYSFKTIALRNAARQALARSVEETLNGDVSNPVTTALGLAKATAEGDKTGQILEQLIRSVTSLEMRSDTQDQIIRQLNAYMRRPMSEGERLGNALVAYGTTARQPRVKVNLPPATQDITSDPAKLDFDVVDAVLRSAQTADKE